MGRILLLEVTRSMIVSAQKMLIPRGALETSWSAYVGLVFIVSSAISTRQRTGGASLVSPENIAGQIPI